jgi:hypothetical protein
MQWKKMGKLLKRRWQISPAPQVAAAVSPHARHGPRKRAYKGADRVNFLNGV